MLGIILIVLYIIMFAGCLMGLLALLGYLTGE